MKTLTIIFFFLVLMLTSIETFPATSVQTFEQGTVTINDSKDAITLFDLRKSPQATLYNISDDGVTGPIALPFSFTFFDRTFNEAYMYSNGVLGFDVPTWQSFCCDGVALNSQLGNDYNYKIMALWADLISGTAGSFYSLARPNDITFGWYNIFEYGTNNLNSFEIQLKNDNTFDIIYGNISMQSHNVTVGITGNLSANQFYQYYTGPGGNLLTSNTSLSVQFQTDPCVDNPLYSTTCPGYQQAFFDYQCSINPLYNIQCAGYAEAYALQNVETAPETSITNTDTTTPTNNQTLQTEPVTSPGMIGDSTSTFNNVRTDAGGISVNANGTVVIETGVPDAVRNFQEAATPGTNIVLNEEKKGSTPELTSKNITSENKKVITTPSVTTTQASVTKFNNSNDDSSIDDVLQYVNVQNDNNIVASINYPSGLSYNSSTHITGVDNSELELIEEKQSPLSVFSSVQNNEQREELGFQKDLIDELLKNSTQLKQEEKNETDNPVASVNKDVKENDISEGGPGISDLNKLGPQIDSYLKDKIQDVAFYKDREIYKNQKTVDNEPIHRNMNYQNDRIFNEMIEDQYKRK